LRKSAQLQYLTHVNAETMLNFPTDYSDVFDQYTSYLLTRAKLSPAKLIRYLTLAHFLEDNDYFLFLIKRVLLMDWDLYSPTVARLNHDITTEIYCHIPYDFVPRDLRLSYNFFLTWIRVNSKPIFEVATPSRTYGYHVGYECYSSNDIVPFQIVGVLNQGVSESDEKETSIYGWYTDPGEDRGKIEYVLEKEYQYSEEKKCYVLICLSLSEWSGDGELLTETHESGVE